MNQAIQAATKLESAVKSFDNIFSCIVSVHYREGITRVHLLYPRDLEQIPGEAVRLESGSKAFPVEFRKTVGSVEFFVWLREEEV